MTNKEKVVFVFTFILLLIGRLSIAGTGYLEDSDELLYIWIHHHFSGFTDVSTWAKCIYHMQGQPPEITIRLIEYCTLLPVSALTGKQMLHPDILYYIGLYNVFVSLLMLYVFFNILRKLHFSFALSMCGVFLLGSLFNFNMYTRHILPYDHALLFQLIAFNVLLRKDSSTKSLLLAGLFSAIGLTTYLGGFMFVFINVGYLVLLDFKSPAKTLKQIALFALPFLLLFSCYELLCKAGGQSYFSVITNYYGTVSTEASLDEGLIYIFLYFFMVEKIWGVCLLFFFFLGSALLFISKGKSDAKNVVLLGVIAYCTYGATVYFLQQLPFHGRVLHIYYPFVVVGALVFLQQQKVVNVNALTLAFVCVALVNYGFVIRDFNRIGYPRNVIYQQHLFERKDSVQLLYYQEITDGLFYSDRKSWFIDSVGAPFLQPGKYKLINVCFLNHYPDDFIQTYSQYTFAKGDSVVFEQLHFQSHPAYTLEYCTRTGRTFFIDKQIKIRVIKSME